MLSISPVYAGLIALLFLGLSFRVVKGRQSHKISIGDGDDKDMIKRMRVQANCAEYAPMGLILLGMLEMQSTSPWILHALGISLLVGRVMHAFGLGSTPQMVPIRIWGMYFTIGMIAVSAVLNII